MQSTKPLRVYVAVNVFFSDAGQMLPRSLVWEDGREYEIDRVKDIRPSYAKKAGGQGDRYTIIVNGCERHIFFEHNPEYGHRDVGRWFVERRQVTSYAE